MRAGVGTSRDRKREMWERAELGAAPPRPPLDAALRRLCSQRPAAPCSPRRVPLAAPPAATDLARRHCAPGERSAHLAHTDRSLWRLPHAPVGPQTVSSLRCVNSHCAAPVTHQSEGTSHAAPGRGTISCRTRATPGTKGPQGNEGTSHRAPPVKRAQAICPGQRAPQVTGSRVTGHESVRTGHWAPSGKNGGAVHSCFRMASRMALKLSASPVAHLTQTATRTHPGHHPLSTRHDWCSVAPSPSPHINTRIRSTV